MFGSVCFSKNNEDDDDHENIEKIQQEENTNGNKLIIITFFDNEFQINHRNYDKEKEINQKTALTLWKHNYFYGTIDCCQFGNSNEKMLTLMISFMHVIIIKNIMHIVTKNGCIFIYFNNFIYT